MTAYDPVELAKLIDQVESSARQGTNQVKGTAMAHLVAHIFGQIPGMELRHREFLNPDGTSEIDLIFRNRPLVSGLFDGVTLHMECKNERRKISAAQVRIFASKLRDHNQPVGIMISHTGLAGKPGTKSYAHGIVSSELGQGRSIVILCLEDLRKLEDTEQLVDICVERRFELEAFRTYVSL